MPKHLLMLGFSYAGITITHLKVHFLYSQDTHLMNVWANKPNHQSHFLQHQNRPKSTWWLYHSLYFSTIRFLSPCFYQTRPPALAAKLCWSEFRTSVSRLLSSHVLWRWSKSPHLWHCFSKCNYTELKSKMKQWNTQKYLFLISVPTRSSLWSVLQQTTSFFREKIAKGGLMYSYFQRHRKSYSKF